LPNEYLSKIGIGSTGGIILKKISGESAFGASHFQPVIVIFHKITAEGLVEESAILPIRHFENLGLS